MERKTMIVLFLAVVMAILSIASYSQLFNDYSPLQFPLLFNDKDEVTAILSANSMKKISDRTFKAKDVTILIFDLQKGKPRKVKYTIKAQECEFIYGEEKDTIKSPKPKTSSTTNPGNK